MEVMGMLGIEFRIWNSNLQHYFRTFPSMFVKKATNKTEPKSHVLIRLFWASAALLLFDDNGPQVSFP